MPIMVRPDDKMKKVAYDILGISTKKKKRTKKKRMVNSRLDFEETARVK